MRSYLGGDGCLQFLRVVRAGLAEKVKFDQRPLGGETESCKCRQEGHNREKSS